MIRPNLGKAVILGLGIAALSSNIVFAQVRIAPDENQRGEIAVMEPRTMTAMDGVDLPTSDEASKAAEAQQGEGNQGDEGNIAIEIKDLKDEVIMYNAGGTDEELIYSTGVAAGAEDAGVAEPDQAVSSEDDFKVQITSTNAETAEDVRTVAAESAPLSDTDTDKGAADSSVLVLAIAGGAVLVGGCVLAAKRKKDK